jgi:hypothetical protein
LSGVAPSRAQILFDVLQRVALICRDESRRFHFTPCDNSLGFEPKFWNLEILWSLDFEFWSFRANGAVIFPLAPASS